MCFGSSKQDDPDTRKNAEIEKQIKADQKRQAREVKMLLLGRPHHISRSTLAHLLTTLIDWQALEKVASRQCSSRCD